MFLVFAGQNYYPLGGWDDYQGSFDSIESAKQFADDLNDWLYDWAHAINFETKEMTKLKGV